MLKFLKFALDPTLSIVYNTRMNNKEQELNRATIQLAEDLRDPNSDGTMGFYWFLIGWMSNDHHEEMARAARRWLANRHPEKLADFDKNLLDLTLSV